MQYTTLTLIFKKHYIDKIMLCKKTATNKASRPMVKLGGIYRLSAGFFNYLPDRNRVMRVYT